MLAARFSAWGGTLVLLLARPASAADTKLADAAEHHDWPAVCALAAESTDVNVPQADGMTALHWAAHYDALDAAKLLIAAGANARATNRYGVTPLALACTNGDPAVIELLIEAGVDANSALPGGETALMTASRTGRLEAVAALIAHGADVNARDEKRQTALMWAAAEGHVDVVDALLKAGADFRTPLSSGFTPLFFAVREGRTGAAFRLIDAGADVNRTMRSQRGRDDGDAQPTNPLLLAVENGHFDLAVALLEAGADPNGRPAGFTALHALTWVRKPIRGDGNPPPTGSGRLTSLEMARQLVTHGADVDARLEHGTSAPGRFTTTGSTPFLLAARASDVPMMKLLLELGADSRVTNADKCTPLLAAAGVGALGDGDEAAGTEEETAEAVQFLLDLGADIDAVDDNGETAMHGAAYQSRAKLVRLLAERGAHHNVWNRENKFGWTPLMIAHGHRPGNFRPAPETIAAVERVMRAEGLKPPKSFRYVDRRDWKE
jgi:ankyrin repeat protein